MASLDRDEIVAALRETAARHLIVPEYRIFEAQDFAEFGLDSLETVELVQALEDVYDVTLPDVIFEHKKPWELIQRAADEIINQKG
jgi:acyl carrier protein